MRQYHEYRTQDHSESEAQRKATTISVTNLDLTFVRVMTNDYAFIFTRFYYYQYFFQMEASLFYDSRTDLETFFFEGRMLQYACDSINHE